MWKERYIIKYLEEIDSTNLEAKRIAINQTPFQNHIVIADKQTASRGRYGRIWESIYGNLHFSILISNVPNIANIHEICFVTSLAVYDAVLALLPKETDLSLRIKWPNDIMINNAKLSGILVEQCKANGSDYVIIGIGLNLVDSPKDLDRQVVSLKSVGSEIDKFKMLDSIINAFELHYSHWLNEGFKKTRISWLQAAYNLNSLIHISTRHEKISGIFQSIDLTGNIILKNTNGHSAIIKISDVLEVTIL